MHYVIGFAGLGFCAYGYAWSAQAMGIPETFERSLLTDLRFGIGAILLALAAVVYRLRRTP